MWSKIKSFLLVFIINIEIAKINTSFLSYLSLFKSTLRYNDLFDQSFNM